MQVQRRWLDFPSGRHEVGHLGQREVRKSVKCRSKTSRESERDEERVETSAAVDVYFEMICIKFLPGDPGETGEDECNNNELRLEWGDGKGGTQASRRLRRTRFSRR